MKFLNSNLDGVIKIELNVYEDTRGGFCELYKEKEYKEVLGKQKFVQDNISISQYNVLRGLHFQVPPFEQGKLVTCYSGGAYDFVVDLRPASPTFKEWCWFLLQGNEKTQLWIPAGFAHGFYSFEDETMIAYKLTSPYNKNSERTLLWSDPDINIDWSLFNIIDPIMSQKDKDGLTLDKLLEELKW